MRGIETLMREGRFAEPLKPFRGFPEVPQAPATHAFLPGPIYRDLCDRKLDDAGRVRTCAAPASDPVHQVEAQDAGAELVRLRAVDAAAREYIAAHGNLVETERSPEAARRLADAWIALNDSVGETP